jgi:hypothetical protein
LLVANFELALSPSSDLAEGDKAPRSTLPRSKHRVQRVFMLVSIAIRDCRRLAWGSDGILTRSLPGPKVLAN